MTILTNFDVTFTGSVPLNCAKSSTKMTGIDIREDLPKKFAKLYEDSRKNDLKDQVALEDVIRYAIEAAAETIHHNACTESMTACKDQWLEEYQAGYEMPPIPEINYEKKQ